MDYSARHPAYVIHTSGSTGKPKGVVITRESLGNLFAFHRAEISARTDHRMRVSLAYSLSFDASWNPLCWMLAGHELHLLEDDVRRDAREFVRYVDDNRIDVVEVTPSYAEQLLEFGLLECGVSVLIVGGESVGAELWQRVRDSEHVIGYDFYGPTECTVDATTCRMSDTVHPSIGRPLRNTRAYVLDGALLPAPTGATGLLYLAGTPVARGYLGEPALTALRFVADPYGPPGERMYCTGDLARWTRDGRLEFLGRADEQVKVRGFRIEPDEIAAVLTEHPGVGRAAVVARADRLVAYVVPANDDAHGDTRVDVDELRRHVASRLPDYLVPSGIVPLAELPLTANGKLDRRNLPAPRFEPAGRPARTTREEALCGLFAEVLGLDAVGVADNFFALGGHSLLATRLVGRVRAALGGELSVRSFFQAPTVLGVLDSLTAGTPTRIDPLLPIRPTGDQPPLFCVHPVSGVSWCYAGLHRHLPAEVPIYGLQVDVDEHPLDLAELAEGYARRIRQVRPTGPYRLLGWSLGGRIAHAVAGRLQADGEQVELLALLDAFPGGELPGETDRETAFDLLETAILRTLAQDLGLDAVNPVREDVASAFGLPEPALAELTKASGELIEILLRGTPSTFHGDLEFFTARHSRPGRRGGAELWREHISGAVHDHLIDCGHFAMMRPESVAVIGAALTERLAAR